MGIVKIVLLSALGALILGVAMVDGAQASASEWSIEGETLEERGLEKETVSLGGALGFSIPSLKIAIECGSLEGSGTIFNGGSDEETVTLSSCSIVGAPGCKVAKPIKLSFKLESLAFDDDDKVYSKESLGAIATEGAEKKECTLPKEALITGVVAGEVPVLEGESVSRPLKFSQATSEAVNKELGEEKESGLELKYGTSQAFLSGELTMTLSGAMKGNDVQRAHWASLCLEAAQTCPGASLYPTTRAVVAKAIPENVFKYKLATVAKSVTCAESKFEGEVITPEGWELTVEITKAIFNGCSGGCGVNPVAETLPWLFTFTGDGNMNDGYALLTFVPSIWISCSGMSCKFALGDSPVRFRVLGGGPGYILGFSPAMPFFEGNKPCESGTWTSTGPGGVVKYEFIAPSNPLFVAG